MVYTTLGPGDFESTQLHFLIIDVWDSAYQKIFLIIWRSTLKSNIWNEKANFYDYLSWYQLQILKWDIHVFCCVRGSIKVTSEMVLFSFETDQRKVIIM